MKKRQKISSLFIALIAVIFFCTTTQAQPVTPISTTSINADYVRALFTADKFLSAWKNRSVEAGIALLSPEVKKKVSNDELVNYISGTSSPSHAAFEIKSGRKIANNRYAFEVKLYEYLYSATPEAQTWDCPQSAKIILVKTGVDNPKFRVGNWLVNELPTPCELILR
ncbi:hypothetical protein [Cylindrospermum sp. FACHB-282]|uniref:hypothetical protein n=1 Tax=Cylindrospermum sp. FACHB-282 TaxID=2692794 RepID=UPI0016855BB0|nr:hypothetical protein [Cylindrospermum sp. FACHB-282]MBD2384816.1 hypothetical protein [Cylindrospermum sp. FACHB-282]